MRDIFYRLFVVVSLVLVNATVQAQGLVLVENQPGLGYGVVQAPDALARLKYCVGQRSGQQREAQCYKQILGFQRNILQAGDNPDVRPPAALPSDCRDLGFWDDPFMPPLGSMAMAIYQCPPGENAQPSVVRSTPQDTVATPPPSSQTTGKAQEFEDSGRAKQAKGDADGAIADYTQAIQLDPDRSFVYINRGVARMNKKDFDGAIADSTEAIRLLTASSTSFSADTSTMTA